MPGRHKKSDIDKRHTPVACRLTHAEIATIDDRRGSLSRGAYLRIAALGAALPAPVPAANTKIIKELARIGNNLNQIALYFNAVESADDAESLKEMREYLYDLRMILAGAKA